MSERHGMRMRFWYLVHNMAEALWHWVWYAKIQPHINAQPQRKPEQKFYLIATLPVTPDMAAKGYTEQRAYRTTYN